MLHRLCHSFRFLSFSLLWCTTLCHIFALARPLARRNPHLGTFPLKISWRIPGQGYIRISNGYHGEEGFGLLFTTSNSFVLEAYKAPNGLLKIELAEPIRYKSRKGHPSGDINLTYYRDLHLTAHFDSDFDVTRHIAIIKDPVQLVKKTNELINTHPKYVEDFEKPNSERKANDQLVTLPEVTAPTDAFTWLHTTFMYLTMVGALDGSELFKEWFETDVPFFETALSKARAQRGSTKQLTH
ncbi:hypothetical protein EV361DRAFT_383430 [Lentinula raphanica]|nr:hypothetical protein EV361DRAFT_383430 [Lentinula raphanica]